MGILEKIVIWIILGLIAGIVARWLMPGKIQGGYIITICLGIAGSLVGGFLCHLLGFGGEGWVPSLIIAVGGAVLLLFLYDFLRRRKILI